MTTRKPFKPRFALSAIAIGVAAALRSAQAWAQTPPSVFGYEEGDTIVNPTTGAVETIVQVITNPYGLVLTDDEHYVWAGPTTDNATFVIPGTPEVLPHPEVPPSPGHPGSPAEPGRPAVPDRTYRIEDILLGPDPTPGNGQTDPGPPIGITTLCIAGCDGTPQPQDLDYVTEPPEGSFPPGFFGGQGQGARDITTDLGELNGDQNRYAERPEGRYGDNGDDGWGFEVCFFGCWTVGEAAEDGDPGQTGGDSIEDLNVNPARPNNGHITSVTQEAPGIWMSSRGGNGGMGGDAYGALPAGNGGAAGAGGTVLVTSELNITTTGFQSYGIFAQSQAGFGGDGGNGYIFSGSGNGGPAAEAGNATAVNDGDGVTTGRIITTGDNAIGIYVQSIGGGGGNAGSSYGVVGDAGSAAFGGNAGMATAENRGLIQTDGIASHGVMAQSVGGKGGNGGDVGGLTGIGGGASGGGDGDVATALNSGSITTLSAASVGLFAQSVGGGGGDGGNGGGIVSVGGSGGAGGNGAVATATNAVGGDIFTQGSYSYGVVAQSIGGGGGNGGSSGGISAIGGGGTSGGRGGHATANNSGSIETEGTYATGMVVQSIGGGGGAGGQAGGVVAVGGSSQANTYGASPNNGGEVDANNFAGGSILTENRGAHGIVAQSIGGGGGMGGGANGAVGIGGSGGTGGHGWEVDVLNQGTIETLGEDAKGIIAQSIGGGGGTAGNAGGVMAIGGSGAGGGNAWDVTVTNGASGVIGTHQRGSDGILAQSIGGGGGNGGSGAGLSAIGGSGSTGGTGYTVTVDNAGSIYTGLDVIAPGVGGAAGAWSRGILAQSIGGGGGTGGDGSGAIGGSGGGGGAGNSGNTVTVTNSGLISTRGNMSSAIEAQSIGGGGGSGGAGDAGFFAIGGNGGSGGNGGAVNITNERDLSTWGHDSHGIFAQSIGGGGGNGGNSTAIGIFGAVAIGGHAGGGGSASSVIIDAGSGSSPLPGIHTQGDRAKGILAQSVGGGGGNGGFAVAAGAGYIANSSASVGGDGGAGGDANLVQISGDTRITTEGTDADGIVAQSVGGSGGNGGFAMSFSFAAGDIAAGAFATSIGGDGGGAGNGNTVRLRNGGAILTTGDQSDGIVAQSVGGGGGNGGFSVAFTGVGAAGANAAASVSVGGNGGAGGFAGLVDAEYDGDIRTEGDDAFGVVLQSVGGGGGNGGFTIAGAVAGSGGGSAGVAVGVGGGGGAGGAAGQVLSTITGDITTLGDRSTGLIAQSIGGRGGNGGFNISGAITGSGGGAGSVAVGVGGAGAGGGTSERVDVTVNGNVVTTGDDADAVVAQSVGGGGGNGGMNVSGTLTASGGGGGGVAVGVGGEAGAGSNGNVVDLTVNGNIDTFGRGSNALVAQSIGGSGGNGGMNVSGQLTATGGGGGGAAVGIGGSGGAGGNASAATGTLNGNAATRGENATAVIVQSLGGGGGNGGMNASGGVVATGSAGGGAAVGIGGSGGAAGDGALTTLRITGNVDTVGANSGGVLAQSLGGGGGNGGMSIAGQLTATGGAGGGVAVGVGGSGGDGGTGGVVDALITGNVHTRGDQSMGVIAQSLGGGGGNGGLAVAGVLTATGSTGGGVAVGVGGSGGGAGNAARVDADVIGDITTEGDNATGFLAQSLGGGGGNGGMSVASTLTASGSNAAAVAVGIGGSGGDGGDGEVVDASVTGNAQTWGDNSAGVVAQSLGGGGGNGGLNVSAALSAGGSNSGAVAVGVGGSGGGAGIGRQTTLRVDGTVQTHGANSAGVIAQSLGGGGGNGGMNVSGTVTAAGSNGGSVAVGVGGAGGSGGGAGLVTATVDGGVTTWGANSTGFIAQSIGGSGGNGALNATGALSATGSSGGAVAVGVGGGGGGAGIGGEVQANVSNGSFDTHGANSHGVLAQSVGGGGGSGGMNVSGAVAGSAANAGALAVGVGGSGGGGGNAGLVTGRIDSEVVTRGDDSFGVFLQSVGGGGGSGAMNVSGAMSLANGSGAALAVGVGGMGGDGGDGLAVDGEVSGGIRTEGNRSIGVLAQSVGGGGGAGGLNVSAGLSITKQGGGAAALGVGGFGGNGGDAGTVLLTRTGSTHTAGADAHGVIAQSVGGGGGSGGMNVSGGVAITNNGNSIAASLGLGGFGGGGGNAQAVDATVNGDVIATGYGSWTEELEDEVLMKRTISGGSNGILAQSVGGGGGTGGMNISGGIAYDRSSQGESQALSLGVGGFGGGGGNAGTVNLTVNAARVESVGDERFAIGAQSIGGNGGSGGVNVSGGIAMDGVLTAGVGGFGGGGGIGNTVTANATVSSISATGANATGFLVQSVGGDGGNGAINVSGGIQGLSDTQKPSLVFGLGGFGGAGNVSGVVDATQRGDIDVQGRNSIGIFAQSVAGGGGNGALNVSGNFSRGKEFAISIGIGGSAGDGADAGQVTLVSDGNITADGRESPETPDNDGGPETLPNESIRFFERANGVLVQSIGGGGGNGGINATGVAAPNGSTLNLGVGGSGGGGGHAGEVHVRRGENAAGTITTYGNNAAGLVAQSVGGGGGNAGANLMLSKTDDNDRAINIGVGGSGADAGDGKQVDVFHVGDITTSGARSIGLLAQSVGGGGGNATYNLSANKTKARALNIGIGGDTGPGGDGGDVDVDHRGDITTGGNASAALFAQSVGGGGGNAGMDLIASFGSSEGMSIGLGRVGGTGGDGGDVNVQSKGALATAGDQSVGLFAQSVGKGGGSSSSSSLEVGSEGAEKGSDKAVSFEIGLTGGLGGIAGDVAVTALGSIVTEGQDSHGIFAQSAGGGGGTGGAIERQPAAMATTQVMVGVGGSGGNGGIAGAVQIVSDADIGTRGDKSHGIYAQSVGGGGGVGGHTLAVDFESDAGEQTSNTLAVSVGGTGGVGSYSKTVDVTNTGRILTEGFESHGINAESLGGGGGTSGAMLSFSRSSGKSSRSLAVNVGGSGGSGGVSDRVTVTNEGTIATAGDNSVGIRARSIGGKGGDGGIILHLGIQNVGAEQKSQSLTLNVGGQGGDGGVGGDVEVINRTVGDRSEQNYTGVIATEGRESHGIFAQSIGGGGGNGSSIITSNAGRSDRGQVTLIDLAFGGKGGTGGKAGDVTVDNDGRIQTLGDQAHGIYAQSLGGGGGNGGLVIGVNAVLASHDPAKEAMLMLGGAGGSGDDAGNVIVNNSGSIHTEGERSHGIFAQSIGGGGGNAGVGFGASSNPGSMAIAGALSAAFGGRGGAGGLGGEVTVNHTGDITVLGANSQAVLAESINGGGGHVVLDFNGVATLPGVPETIYDKVPMPQGIEETSSLRFFGGGVDQQNSIAGNVTLNLTGRMIVAGQNGVANAVQAVGGGGGTYDLTLRLHDTAASDDDVAIEGRLGGLSGDHNRGGDIASAHEGDLVTEGDNTPGALVQSIGGGGGRANLDITSTYGSMGETSLTLGGENGNDEEGGNLQHRQQGSTYTDGAAAHGGVFQSVGGGGGSLTLLAGGTDGDAAPAAARYLPLQRKSEDGTAHGNPRALARAAAAPRIGFGSHGGSLLKGGHVALGLEGDVATTGNSAVGMVFQSVGAGGGIANLLGVEGIEVTLGGATGASGAGGDIEVTNDGDLITQGARAHGVVLQSVGGGGGAVFTDATEIKVNSSAGNTGDGGDIRFVQNGTILARGEEATALLAQSVAGGGGFVDGGFAGSAGGAGTAGAIDLQITGDVGATGERGVALFAQSVGADGRGNDITVQLAEGHSLVGGVDGVAARFDGGAVNTFTNRGSVYTLSRITGTALLGGAGGDFFDNHGGVMGNIDLGGGENRFANQSGAMLYSGELVNLGDAANVLVNDGLLSPGGNQLAVHTRLAGSFVQSASGRSDLELDFATRGADQVTATGTASTGGLLHVTLMNPQFIRSGQHYQPFFVATGGATNAGAVLDAQRSIVIDYGLHNQSAQSMGLLYTVDFSPVGLTGNRNDVGDYLNRVTSDGAPAALDDTVATAVLQTDLGAYASMLTQLGTEFYAEQQALALSGTQRFARNLQNCGTSSIGETTGDETGCFWARYDNNPSSRESRAGYPAMSDESFSVSSGVQVPRDGDWTLGVAFDFEDHKGRGYGDLWTSEATFIQFGSSLRRELSQGAVGATLSVGHNAQQITRRIAVTEALEAQGDQSVYSLANVLDYTMDLSSGGFSFQPSINLGSALLYRDSMREQGAGAQNATIDHGSEFHLWVEPALGGRYRLEFGSGASLRTFVRVGYLHYLSGTSTALHAGLEGAPAGVASMQISSDLDRQHWIGEAGLQWQAASGMTMGFSYSHRESELREGGSGSIRFALPLE